MEIRTTIARQRRVRKILVGVLSLILALLGSTWLLISNTTSAHAASMGTGITFDRIDYLGSFKLANGSHAYCVEIKVLEPWSPQKPVSTVNALPAFEGDLVMGTVLGKGGELRMPAMTDAARMRQMNYVMSKWGETDNAAQGASVAVAMFQIRGDHIGYNDALHTVLGEVGGQHIVDRAASMVAEARREAIAPVSAEPTRAPDLSIDEDGNGTLQYYAGTTKLSLHNAVFADTGESSRTIDGAGEGTVAIAGLRPDGWDASFSVSATAEWATGRDGWKAELRLHEPTVPGEQRIAEPTGKTTGFAQSGSHRVTAEATRGWAPTLRTQVIDHEVSVGERFGDTVTLGSDARWGDWPTDSVGSFLPVVATGTLYGPLASDPTLKPAAEPPSDAPIALTTTLHVDRGPGEYRVESNKHAYESGFYTWVWRIDWDAQAREVIEPERTGRSVMAKQAFPVNDGFGLADETHVVRQRLTLATRLAEGEVGLGWSIIDDVSITPETYGGWLLSGEGSPIPVVLRGAVYFTADRPERRATPSDEAQLIAETYMTVTGPGIVTSDTVPLPVTTEGYVTVQWCIRDEDQPEEFRGYTREWCDDFGAEGEVAKVSRPTVTTQAQKSVVLGDTMHDVARVEGLVPHLAELTFTAMLYPEAGKPRFGPAWEDTGEVWTSAELAKMTENERCLAQPVAVTTPLSIVEAGTYESAQIATGSSGTVYWVETLTAVDPITEERVIVHEGKCGIAEETTVITEPKPEPEPQPEPNPELAVTGSSGPDAALWAALGATLLAVGTVLTVRRKKHALN